MSFNVTARPTFSETVVIRSPDGLESDFVAIFEALDIPEFETFDLEQPSGTKAFLERVMQGAEDLIDADGEAVAYTAEIKQGLIGKAWVRLPLVRAYLEGINRAARGN